ncbi:hypothetical protein GOP47_0028781 [Adiantum capillus-veneris]|nr:hypothetical protein GOP47_0028781 [Adiantum capillus-veneris]
MHPTALQSSPQLSEKELREKEGKDTTLGVDLPHVQTLALINPRPKKELINVFELHEEKTIADDEEVVAKSMGGDKKLAIAFDQAKKGISKNGEGRGDAKKVDEASLHKELEQGVGSSNAPFMMPLPYVDIFLLDGRLARQCCECPWRFRFELVRWWMEGHLKREHMALKNTSPCKR